MTTSTVYDVSTTFVHPDGHESYKPLMLQVEQWAQLADAGVTQTLRYGYTREEAEQVAALSLPFLTAEHEDFLAAGGSLRNVVDIFFG